MGNFDAGQNERLRKRMREWIAENESSQGALAARLRITGASLSNILKPGGGAGYVTATAFARLIGVPLDDVIGPAAEPPAPGITRGGAPNDAPDSEHFSVGAAAARLDGATDLDVEMARRQAGAQALRWPDVRQLILAKQVARQVVAPKRRRSTELEVARAVRAMAREAAEFMRGAGAPTKQALAGGPSKRAKPVISRA